jgi:putative peptidoglycan lipid II flippase
VWTAWGATIGSVLQVAVQLPPALRVSGGIRWTLRTDSPDVRAVLRNFMPAFVSRGVVQISAFVDAMISSLLPVGAVAGLSNAQMLYTLPVSLFGMSVAAAELPELSATTGEGAERHDALRQRLAAAGAQVTYFIVPSAVAFLALGHVVAGLVFQSGAFRQADAYYVWGVLAGATVGLLATSLGGCSPPPTTRSRTPALRSASPSSEWCSPPASATSRPFISLRSWGWRRGGAPPVSPRRPAWPDGSSTFCCIAP